MSHQVCEIVTYRPEYRADFARLNYAWIETLFAVEPVDRRVLDNPEEEILAHGGQIFFAVRDHRVLGTVAVKVEDAATFELTKMAVDESARGHGYGKKLLAAAMDYARTSGAKRMVLSSHTSLAPAIDMYRKAGFVARPPCGDSCYSRCNVFMDIDL